MKPIKTGTKYQIYDDSIQTYDVSRNSTVIPAIGLEFDFDDYDEDSDEIKAYKRLKPASLTFTRRHSPSLHYLV